MKVTVIINDEIKTPKEVFNSLRYKLDFYVSRKNIPNIISDFGQLYNKYKNS